MSIKPLNKETIKLINSTQVISSIYSAVKELVENSVDAEAQNIEVNLIDNGLSLIEVKDNGIGINREDAQYMALPAYTSKISDFNDLDLLSTYGFRGEGLTSVCQVSDVTVCTKTVDDEATFCYTLDNEGHIISSELSHGLTGTTVQMRNLFKNMPVRRNILNNKKRINQEIKATELLLKQFAICKPLIRFMFRVNSNVIFTKPCSKDVAEAIKSVLGIQIFSKLTSISKSFSQTDVSLFIPKKEIKDCAEISQVGLQFLCVNNRPVKAKEIEKRINKRISDYFNQNASNSRKFIFCLILKVDPSMLDVNLEPNKDKVFLQNEAAILEEIDKSLLSFYDIPDSQASTQSDVENINCNGKAYELSKEKENEKEWPACKKRKFNLQNENIQDISIADKNILRDKQVISEIFKKSDKEFLKSIDEPVLSDSDSNDAEGFIKKKLDKKKNEPKNLKIPETTIENSEFFDYAQDVSKKKDIEVETLSQLPVVDLGEDFDWQEVIAINKTSTKNEISNKQFVSDTTDTEIIKQEITGVTWSKGQVPGLQGGVAVTGLEDDMNSNLNQMGELQENLLLEDSEPFDYQRGAKKINSELMCNDEECIQEVSEFQWDETVKNEKKRKLKQNNSSPNISGTAKQTRKSLKLDPTQTKIPFAGDNACLSVMGPSAFAMYCADMRAKIVKKYPEFSPAEVAAYLNKKWKEILPEEREHYRDLANQHSQRVSKSPMTQARKPKSQLSQDEKEKNRKHLVNLLGKMKINKTEVKNESMIMRTFVPWNVSLSSVTEKLKRPITSEEKSIIGPLNSSLWIIKLSLNIFVFNVSDMIAQLNVKDLDTNQINAKCVKDLIDQWFLQKKDMSIFHPLHSIER